MPAPRDESRTAEIFPSALVLLSTMIGGGLLTLPFAFAQVGIAGGLILLIVSGIAAGFSLYILIASARRTGASSYSGVAADAYGPIAATTVSVLTLVLTFMCMVAYSVLLRDLAGTAMLLFGDADDDAAAAAASAVAGDDDAAAAAAAAASGAAAAAAASTSNGILIALLLLFVFPMSLNRSLGALSFVTPMCLGAMASLTLAIAYRGSLHALNQWADLNYR